jgi:hypothetical protein
VVLLCAKELHIVLFRRPTFYSNGAFIDLGRGSFLFNYLLVIISQSQSDCLGSLGQPFFYVAGCDYEPVTVLLSRPVKKHSLILKNFVCEIRPDLKGTVG